MPDDDLTFGQLRFRIGCSPRSLRATIARLKIEPRLVGTTTFYTLEQADRIEAEYQRLKSKTGMVGTVYFMQPANGGPIKIGYSRDVEHRRNRLQEDYKTSMKILATTQGGLAEERRIHAQFAHLRIEGTEQFLPKDDLMDFIRSLVACV